MKYDSLKAPLYEFWSNLITGEVDPPADTDQVFNQQTEFLKSKLSSEELKDTDGVDIDTNEIKGKKGIPNFWLQVLKNHHLI